MATTDLGFRTCEQLLRLEKSSSGSLEVICDAVFAENFLHDDESAEDGCNACETSVNRTVHKVEVFEETWLDLCGELAAVQVPVRQVVLPLVLSEGLLMGIER